MPDPRLGETPTGCSRGSCGLDGSVAGSGSTSDTPPPASSGLGRVPLPGEPSRRARPASDARRARARPALTDPDREPAPAPGDAASVRSGPVWSKDSSSERSEEEGLVSRRDSAALDRATVERGTVRPAETPCLPRSDRAAPVAARRPSSDKLSTGPSEGVRLPRSHRAAPSAARCDLRIRDPHDCLGSSGSTTPTRCSSGSSDSASARPIDTSENTVTVRIRPPSRRTVNRCR